MAFQIKDFSSIAAGAINWMKTATTKVTDFNIGSVVRTLIEAVAAEIDELYQQMFIGLREAIPVSVYNSFSFGRIEAVAASGLVRVTIAAAETDVFIPSGTTFSVAGSSVTYTATQDRTIAAGNTQVDVPVVAGASGVVGNLAAGSAFTMSPTPDGFLSATNMTGLINGVDQETDEARKLRFNAFIASLNRGTVVALEYGLKLTVLRDASGNETERVITTAIVEPWLDDPEEPISLVKCYVHNGAGGTSPSLVNQAREVLYGYYEEDGAAVPGWKAAGVQVEVYAATEQALAVAGVLTELAGYVKADLVDQAELAVANYIKMLPIGATAVRSEIIAIVMNIEGVYNFVPSAPVGDTAVAKNVKLMPGAIAID